MKQEKERVVFGRIFLVQQLNSRPSPLQQQFISRQDLFPCVAEIRKESEVKVRIPIRDMIDLQIVKKAINVLQTREHRGDDDHRAEIWSYAGGIIQARQRPGFQQQRCQPVYQRHGQLAGTKNENKGK